MVCCGSIANVGEPRQAKQRGSKTSKNDVKDENQPEGKEQHSAPSLLEGLRSGSFLAAKANSNKKDEVFHGNLLGCLIQKIVSILDSRLLGVEVHTSSVVVEPFLGTVELRELKVDNPVGFKSQYLLHAERVFVQVNLPELIRSLGAVIEITELALHDVDIIYEKSLKTSNLDTLVKKVEGQAEAQASEDDKGAEGKQAEMVDHTVILRKLSVESVGAKVCTSLGSMAGPRVAIENIHYDDFHNSSGGVNGVVEVCKLVVASLAKSFVASILGKHATDNMSNLAEHATYGASNVAKRMSKSFSGGLHRVAERSRSAMSHVPLPHKGVPLVPLPFMHHSHVEEVMPLDPKTNRLDEHPPYVAPVWTPAWLLCCSADTRTVSVEDAMET